MDYLRKTFNKGNKKNTVNLLVIFILGIILMLSGNRAFKSKNKEEINNQEYDQNNNHIINTTLNEKSFEERIEARLEALLSKVKGVGEVKVMVTLTNGREIVVATNKTLEEKENIEKDSEGGERQSRESKSSEEKIIIRDERNVDIPLILKEIEPKVEGVVIVAEGGGNSEINEMLKIAAQTVLGIESHRVQVLKMK